MRFRWQIVSLATVLALLLGGCGDDDGSPAPSAPLRVMTYNVLCSFCNPREFDPWTERLAYFQDIFTRHDPDLIGVQELTPLNNEIDDILAHAPGYVGLYFGTTPQTLYPDAMILYRESRFTVLDRGSYWLSPTPDEPFTTGFSPPQFPRLVVWALLHDSQRDHDLYFATTHFDNNSPSQQLSAPLVKERTLPFVGDTPVIVVGDFNSRPDSVAYHALTDDSGGFAFENAFDLTSWRIVTNQTPAPEYEVGDRIDHIFLAGEGVSWTASDWLADLTVYGANDRYPSDHFPVFAVVDYSER